MDPGDIATRLTLPATLGSRRNFFPVLLATAAINWVKGIPPGALVRLASLTEADSPAGWAPASPAPTARHSARQAASASRVPRPPRVVVFIVTLLTLRIQCVEGVGANLSSLGTAQGGEGAGWPIRIDSGEQ